MIDARTARILLDLGHGVGVLSAHALLRNHTVFRDADEIPAIQRVADAFRAEGEPAVADAIEEFVRAEYGKVAPAVEGRVIGP